MVEKQSGSRNTIRIGRRPLVRSDIIKMLSKQRMHQVLDVAFIFDVHRRSVLAAQAQLARYHVKPLAKGFCDGKVVRLTSCRIRGRRRDMRGRRRQAAGNRLRHFLRARECKRRFRSFGSRCCRRRSRGGGSEGFRRRSSQRGRGRLRCRRCMTRRGRGSRRRRRIHWGRSVFRGWRQRFGLLRPEQR